MKHSQRFGLTVDQWDVVQKELITPLIAQGARLWCFGSRARGDHQPFSDLDIMVESDRPLGAQLAQIREFFQRSNFPYKIDLVSRADFAASYLPSFERDKVRLATD